MPLGIEGFTYADLYEPARLRDLYEIFCRDVAQRDPAFWGEWDAYRQAPDSPRTPMELSRLVVAMAPHVSWFVATLFKVDDARAAAEAATAAMEPLFRFKVDFVRKRALPLVKGHAKVSLESGDAAAVDALVARLGGGADRELAIATEIGRAHV